MKRTISTITIALTLFGFAASASADVLRFSPGQACSPSLSSCSDWDLIDQSYGDREGVDFVWGDVSSGDAPGMQYWKHWGGTRHAIFAGVDDDSSVGQIDIVALSGYLVSLNGFDLAAFESDRTSQWVIEDLAGGIVASSGGLIDVLFSGPTSILTDLTSAAGFRVTWGPNGYNVGLDNLRFSVAGGSGGDSSSVPEPGTLLLLGLGLAGLGFRNKR